MTPYTTDIDTDTDDSTVPEAIFVYGTLRGGDNRRASVSGFTVDRTGSYPTITPDGEDVGVAGELRPVNGRDDLRLMDTYEGVPILYKRIALTETVHTYVGDPERLGCDVAEHAFDEDELQAHADEHAELHINERVDE